MATENFRGTTSPHTFEEMKFLRVENAIFVPRTLLLMPLSEEFSSPLEDPLEPLVEFDLLDESCRLLLDDMGVCIPALAKLAHIDEA